MLVFCRLCYEKHLMKATHKTNWQPLFTSAHIFYHTQHTFTYIRYRLIAYSKTCKPTRSNVFFDAFKMLCLPLVLCRIFKIAVFLALTIAAGDYNLNVLSAILHRGLHLLFDY